MVPVVFVRGRATGKARSNPLAALGAPALPIGPGARALAEATLALSIMGAVRLIGIAWIEGSEDLPFAAMGWLHNLDFAQIAGATAAGAVILLPTALAWGLPAGNLNLFMWRPLVVAVIATALHAVGGPLGTWQGVILTGVLLSALVLASTRIEAVPGRCCR